MNDKLRIANHWVPASYLTPFTVDGQWDSILYVYRREEPREPLELPPKAVAKEKYLYVPRIEGRELDDSLERVLATHVEPQFALIRNRLVWGRQVGLDRSLSDDERRDLATFLAFQQLRTQAARDTIEYMQSFMGTLMMRSRLEDLRAARAEFIEEAGIEVSEHDLAELRDQLDRGDMVVAGAEGRWLATALRTIRDVAEAIFRLNWRVVDLPPGVTLPTCDDPLVIIRRASGSDSYRVGGGWLEPGVEATLALSPKCVLVLSISLAQFPDIGTEAWARSLVERTVKHAQRWVFSPVQDSAIGDYLAESDAPSPVIEFGGEQYAARGDPNQAVLDLLKSDDDEGYIRFGPRR